MTKEKQKCNLPECENNATEFFGDVDRKKGYCQYHASLIEQYADTLGEDE